MVISKIIENGINYPTEVYYQYNLYLIDKFKKFIYKLNKFPEIKEITVNNTRLYCERSITELSEILEQNISHDIENAFCVMDWEGGLISNHKSFELLSKAYNEDGYPMNIKCVSIDVFLRKVKLKSINEKS